MVNEIEGRLAAVGDPATAEQQRRYMKSTSRFHGVPTATLRAEAKRLLTAHPELDHRMLIALVEALWKSGWWDLRSVAIMLLDLRSKKLLGPRDLPFLIALVRDAACWAHVDELAATVIGAVLAAHPEERAQVRVWARDADSFWVRRTALLAQLRVLRRGGGDFALFEEIAIPMLGEKEFFIRKAIGWVLRDVSKKRPELVRGFVARHRERMSGLSLREATKYL